MLAPVALGAQAPRAKPKVMVIGTGGTISGHAQDRSALQSYRAGTYPIQVMVDYNQALTTAAVRLTQRKIRQSRRSRRVMPACGATGRA